MANLNELKPEDVMMALEEFASLTNCNNMRYLEGCGHFCKVLREPIDNMAGGRSSKCNEHCEHYSPPRDEELFRAALALLREKDAEIERLTKERDLANAEREANVKGFTEDMSRMSVELDAMRAAANSLKMHLENARAEAITEFVKLFDKEVSNNFVHYGWYIKQVILPKISKKLQEDLS